MTTKLNTLKIYYTLILLVLLPFQNIKAKADKDSLITISGIVIDQVTHKPISGVQLKALGNVRYASMTDEEGKFSMRLPSYVTALYVHAPEYLSQKIAIPNNKEKLISISMLSDKFKAMYDEQTTITALRTLKVKHTTGVSIDNDIQNNLCSDVYSTMHSAIPGAGTLMFIRGISSLNADAQPLIVIDGVELDMQRTRSLLHQGQFFNLLNNISPDDVDKIEVIKNATALYGARGSNGVINITTKRGYSMATRIEANISVGTEWIPTLPKMMDAYNYRIYANEMLSTIETLDRKTSFEFQNDDPESYNYNVYHNNTNWTSYVYRQALTQNYSVNVQGGDNMGMYNLSMGYTNAEATIKESDFTRMNVRFNTDIDIINRLKTQIDVSISKTSQAIFDDGIPQDFTSSTITQPTLLSLIKSPLLSPYQYNAVINDFSSLLSDADEMLAPLGNGYSLANPVAILENGSGDNKNILENTLFNVRVSPTYDFGKGWKLTETFSYSLNRQSEHYYRPYTGVPSFEIPEIGTVTSCVGSSFSNENAFMSHTFLTFDRTIFKKHKIHARIGFYYYDYIYDRDLLTKQYSGETNDRNPALSKSASGYETKDGNSDQWKKWQDYITVDYNYNNRYFLTLSLLGEANSRFGENASKLKMLGTSWALFPSIQAGWVITNEKWFPKNKNINYLQLQLGYDISGNDNIDNFASQTTLSSVTYNYYATGLKLTNIGNDEIRWETTRKFNIGLSTHLFSNRLSLAFDYYIHNTNDLLTIKEFENPVAGISDYWTNGGKLRNIGFEFMFSGKPLVNKNWTIEAGFTVSQYKNKIITLPQEKNYTTSIYGEDNILTAIGQPATLFYGYQTDGIYATTSEAEEANLYIKDSAGNRQYFEAGDVKFIDLNGDGMIDANDKTIIGNPNPDIYGNIFIDVTWKSLSLNIGFNYSLGNDIYNYQRSVLNSGSTFYNQQVQTQSHWRYEGQQTEIPRLNYGDPMGNNRMSDRWIEDGSYLRLKTVRLSYLLPVPSNWNWLQGFSIWLEANNMLTFTHYTGNDPEVSTGNSSIFQQGIDIGLLSQSRSLTLGVKINL